MAFDCRNTTTPSGVPFVIRAGNRCGLVVINVNDDVIDAPPKIGGNQMVIRTGQPLGRLKERSDA